MRRLPLAFAVLASLLPASGSHAAVQRTTVVACRAANEFCQPATFDFTRDGKRIFYAERLTGQIRVFNLQTKQDRLVRRIKNIGNKPEQGLLGLKLDPAWPKEGWIYLYYTKADTPQRNVIVRTRRRADKTWETQTLLEGIHAARHHNGGVIRFGPDRKLYVVIGDSQVQERSQDLASPNGKMLRLNKDGSIPADNPFAGSPVWSFGHRNSFGFDFDPRTGRLWETENGPECNDEINLVQKGRNYGWGPSFDCPNTNSDGPNPVSPKHLYAKVKAPTGAAFCQKCGLGAGSDGALIIATLNDKRIRRLVLTADRLGIASDTVIHATQQVPLAVESAPNGRIYYSDLKGIHLLRSG